MIERKKKRRQQARKEDRDRRRSVSEKCLVVKKALQTAELVVLERKPFRENYHARRAGLLDATKPGVIERRFAKMESMILVEGD